MLSLQIYSGDECRLQYKIHAEVETMKYREVRETLRGLGTEVGKYSQAKRIEANETLKNRVSSGMCAGAALDWLRSVLLGGDAGKGPSDKGSMAAHIVQLNSTQQIFYNKRKADLTKLHDAQRDECNKDITELGVKLQSTLNNALTRPGMTQALYDRLQDRATDLYNAEVERTKTYYLSKMGQINSRLQTASLHQQFWVEFGKIVDNKLNMNAYSRLTVGACSSSTVYGPPNGLLTFLNKVLTHDALQAGCGAAMGIAPPGKGAGHAVAVHRLNTGDFHFFDPNFGIYKLTARDLFRAILFLFLKAYPHMEGGNEADNQDYEVTGKVECDFLIYKAPGASPPSVKVMAAGVGAV
jgi:hypothetical protein